MGEFLRQPVIRRILKYALYLFLSLMVQNMLFTQVRPLGVCPMVLPAVAVSVGMFEGPVWGCIFSLFLGFFADMAFVENTILFTVLFPLIAFGAAFVSQFYINKRFFAFMGVALMAGFFTALIQMLLTFAGDAWSWQLVRTALLQTVWSLPPAALAFFPPARWIRDE